MSYSFDGTNDTFTGAFTSTYTHPITMAAWVKVTAHPVAVDRLVSLGNSSSSDNTHISIRTTTVDDKWQANVTNDSAISDQASYLPRIAITAATLANPTELTATSHTFATGQMVTFATMPGDFATPMNGQSFSLTKTGANTFTVPVNATTFGAYTSGGFGYVDNFDGVWFAIVCTFQSDSSRQIYCKQIYYTGTNLQDSSPMTEAFKYIRFGESFTAGSDFTGSLAEVAMWNSTLSTENITSYLAGTPANSIATANLIGYWPLSVNQSSHANQGTDAGGVMTPSGATWSSDHPAISSGSTIVTPSAGALGV